MPELHRALTEGRISPNQLVRIASVATTDNQEEMFEVAKNLSRRALDVFVKDYRQEIAGKNVGENLFGNDAKNGDVNGLFELKNEANSLAGQIEAADEKQAKQAARQKQAKPTRYIPAKTKKILKKEYGVKCAKVGCGRPAAQIHHIRKYALTKDNAPQNLEPLCAGHHELKHKDDIHYRKFRGG